MTIRPALATATALAVLAAASVSRATTLTTDFATWSRHAPAHHATTSSGLALYDTTHSLSLAGGGTLGFDSPVTVLQPLSGWGPWSGSYAGDILDTAGKSLTIALSGVGTAFGLELAPDAAGVIPPSDTFTVTLSDGTTVSPSMVFPPGATQFVGFYDGSGITALTISVATAPDFAFGNINPVPEPAPALLLGMGAMALGLVRRVTRA